MRKPNHYATDASGRKEGRKTWITVSKMAANTAAAPMTADFIPPPTRDQLIAGSANLRRVYKVEA